MSLGAVLSKQDVVADDIKVLISNLLMHKLSGDFMQAKLTS